ncbi:MAG: hypothetical protein FHK79_18210 [Pseudomonas sp.]|nr:MAG: hypothetical protein FHK79_18210 [Pseudomonas sp.]
MSTFSLTRGSEAALGMLASQAGTETLLLTQPARELRAELSIEPFTSDSGNQLLAVLLMREQRHSMTLQRDDGANVQHLADWIVAVANGTLDTAEAVPQRADPSDLAAATAAFHAAAHELNAHAEPAPAQDEQYPPCDFCGVIPDHHPWHGSGMFKGFDSPHIHACNDCRHLLPSRPAHTEQQPEQISLEPALHKLCAEWERQKRLFPELNRGGWMDLAISEARRALSATSPKA